MPSAASRAEGGALSTDGYLPVGGKPQPQRRQRFRMARKIQRLGCDETRRYQIGQADAVQRAAGNPTRQRLAETVHARAGQGALRAIAAALMCL